MHSKINAHNEHRKKQPVFSKDQIRSYPGAWKGQLVLSCTKCQKKLRKDDPGHPLGKLKKALKQCARRDEDKLRLRVIDIPCLKLCPKNGVTVCTQLQLGRGECSVLHTAEQAEQLYLACKEQATGRELSEERCQKGESTTSATRYQLEQ